MVYLDLPQIKVIVQDQKWYDDNNKLIGSVNICEGKNQWLRRVFFLEALKG